MKTIVGLMGPGTAKASEVKLGYSLGRLIAEREAILLCSGVGDLLSEAARGAKSGGGTVLAICPTYNKTDVSDYVDIPVITGMRGGRNYINILSADVVIAIGSTSAGTLSEIAFAIQLNKPLIIVRGSRAMCVYLKQFKSKSLAFAKTANEVRGLLEGGWWPSA